MEELKKKMFSAPSMQGINIQITPELHSENVYQLHEEEINQVFRNHFGIDDNNMRMQIPPRIRRMHCNNYQVLQQVNMKELI